MKRKTTRIIILGIATTLAAWLPSQSAISQVESAAPAGLEPAGKSGGFELPSLVPGVKPANRPQPVKLSASWSLVEGTRQGEVAVHAVLAPNHHIYSVTQPAGGAIASRIELSASPQVTQKGEFKPQRPPEVTLPKAVSAGGDQNLFDVPLEEHRDEVVWRAPIEVAENVDPASLKFELRFSGQVCEDLVGCLPPMNRVAIEATFAGFEKPLVQEYRARRSHAVLSGTISPRVVTPGGKVTLQITATPDTRYYIYAYAPQETSRVSKPTLIGVQPLTGFSPGAVRPSAEPYVNTDTGIPEEPVQSYHKEPVTWTLEFDVARGVKPGEYALGGVVGYQTCFSGGCDSPTGAEFAGTVTVGAATAAGEIPLGWKPSNYGEASELTEIVVPTPGSRDPSTAAVGSSVATGDAAPADGDRSLAGVLVLAFFGGLILNIMPCVLPVIGLKIMSFVQQAGDSRLRILALNVWFSLGLLVVFWALATIPVVLGMLGRESIGWGGQFQYTWFNLTLLSVVFAFGLSFLGVWEIPIPGFVGGGTANDLAEREGYVGAFCKGILATLLATPCAGPLMGPAIGWAVVQSPLVTYTVFTSLGLGMAAPMLVIGAFPSLVRRLPKPGAWMETFKQFMGFVLLGTVVWMFTFLDSSYHVKTLAFLLGLGMACWIVGHVDITADLSAKLLGWAKGASVAAIFGVLAFGVTYGEELQWVPFDRATLDRHRTNNQIVLVDFTADWCLTCKTNERFALNTRDTKVFVERNGIIPIKADKTKPSEDIDSLLKELGNEATVIPFLAIYPPHGAPPITLDGLITKTVLLEKLREAQAAPAPGAQTAHSLSQNERR